MTQRTAADYKTVGDSVSLKKIDGKEFTIVAVEDSNYDDQKGVKITTKESFDGVNKFHTTRFAITKFFDEKVRKDLSEGIQIRVHTELTKSKSGGKDYWVLA